VRLVSVWRTVRTPGAGRPRASTEAPPTSLARTSGPAPGSVTPRTAIPEMLMAGAWRPIRRPHQGSNLNRKWQTRSAKASLSHSGLLANVRVIKPSPV